MTEEEKMTGNGGKAVCRVQGTTQLHMLRFSE